MNKRIQSEVDNLTELEDKRIFLEKILYAVEELQMKEQNSAFLTDSERENLEKQKEKLQRESLVKIDKYFEAFGYPSRAELGQFAAYAPYAAVYYAEGLSGIQEEHFRYFYGAFSFNDIPEELFLSYLLMYYEKMSDRPFELDRSRNTRQNIYSIMDSLAIDY